MKKQILNIFLFIGSILFGSLFAYTLLSPQTIEKQATGFIKQELEKKVHTKLNHFQQEHKENKLLKFSQKILEKNREKIAKIKQNLQNNLHQTIAKTIAMMQNFDCKCRQKYAARIKQGYIEKISFLKKSNERLKEFIKTKYMTIVKDLLHDIRIFAGSNFLIFVSLLVLLYKKPNAKIHVTFIATLLAISTLICSYFYLFEQDWFYTIIYHDYVGYFYLGYIAILFFFLLDIFLNKAKITTEIINMLLSAIGSGFQALSC